MGIPVIFGWGGKLKHVADAGIAKCANYKNFAPHFIGKVKKAVRLYFVPVVPYSTKFYLVCSICQAGYEIPKDKVDELVAEVIRLPSNEEAAQIMNAFASTIKGLANVGGNPEQVVNEAIATVTRMGYQENHVEYVAGVFFRMITDEDAPV